MRRRRGRRKFEPLDLSEPGRPEPPFLAGFEAPGTLYIRKGDQKLTFSVLEGAQLLHSLGVLLGVALSHQEHCHECTAGRRGP